MLIKGLFATVFAVLLISSANADPKYIYRGKPTVLSNVTVQQVVESNGDDETKFSVDVNSAVKLTRGGASAYSHPFQVTGPSSYFFKLQPHSYPADPFYFAYPTSGEVGDVFTIPNVYTTQKGEWDVEVKVYDAYDPTNFVVFPYHASAIGDAYYTAKFSNGWQLECYHPDNMIVAETHQSFSVAGNKKNVVVTDEDGKLSFTGGYTSLKENDSGTFDVVGGNNFCRDSAMTVVVHGSDVPGTFELIEHTVDIR